MNIHRNKYHNWNYFFNQLRLLMKSSEKFLKLVSSIVENGILTSQDMRKEILTNLRFQKDSIIDSLKLVSREEFEVLKKVIQRQEIEIKKLKLKKKKSPKKAKKS